MFFNFSIWVYRFIQHFRGKVKISFRGGDYTLLQFWEDGRVVSPRWLLRSVAEHGSG